MTKQQAMACHYRQELHFTGRHPCTRTVGPRGGVKQDVTVVRVSGRCQTWKTRPEEFRLPVKYGPYENGAVTQNNCGYFHLPEECPLNKGEA